MCGIAGVFGLRAPELGEKMLRVLAHRGPDDQHLIAGQGFTMGARRLSIIDLAGGRQPLSAGPPERTVWAAQNGEIYNFQETRQLLQERGHIFHSRTDTEVIPHLYLEYGDEFCKHLQGMFAISLWDEKNRRGILARDRAGKKPLYYMVHQGALYYASEIKALLQVPGFTRTICEEALHHYLSYKNVPSPLTIFVGISQLPPAHQLVWEDDQIKSIKPFWNLDWTPLEGDPSEAELADELIRRLERGIKRRLIADVPIGFFLSGGLDSSLSTAIAASVSKDPVKTFTLRYSADSSTPGKELDLKCAREIAKQYKTEHFEEELDFSRFQDELPAILSHFDEPFSGVVSTYFLSRLIRKHLKVAISGDGADELFGSYLSHRLARPLHDYWRGERNDLGHFQDQSEFLARLATAEDYQWRYKLLVFTDEEKSTLYSRGRDLGQRFSTLRDLQAKFSGLSARDPLNRVLEMEFNTQLPDQVLAFADRLSMAHSLEIRTAFLDTEVMEFAARIPGRFKIHGQEIKSVLKTAARRFLPSSAIDRPKEGFVMPVNQWLGQDLFPFTEATLSEKELNKHGYFEPSEVKSMLSRFHGGEHSLANKILSLLCFQIWHQCYIEQNLPLPLGDAQQIQVTEACAG